MGLTFIPLRYTGLERKTFFSRPPPPLFNRDEIIENIAIGKTCLSAYAPVTSSCSLKSFAQKGMVRYAGCKDHSIQPKQTENDRNECFVSHHHSKAMSVPLDI